MMYMDTVKLSVAELFLNPLINEVSDYQPFIPLFIENPVSHNTRFLLTACPLPVQTPSPGAPDSAALLPGAQWKSERRR